jgi:hypothetical protein
MPLYRLLLVMIPAGFELRTVTVEFPCGKASQPGTANLFQLFPQWSLASGISTLSLFSGPAISIRLPGAPLTSTSMEYSPARGT